jgi:hypothetical protein
MYFQVIPAWQPGSDEQPGRTPMKCPKCGGRTVTEDVHTYLGREQERKCIVCGKRFIELAANAKPAPEVFPGRQGKTPTAPDLPALPVLPEPDTAGSACNPGRPGKRDIVENPNSPWRTQLYKRAALPQHVAEGMIVGFDLASGPDQTVGAIVEAGHPGKEQDWQVVTILPGDQLEEVDCNSGARRTVQGRGQRAEGRGLRAEGRGQRAEGRGQRAEGRGRRR